MYDSITSGGADRRVDVDHEPPALDEINHRLGNIDQTLNKALAGVNEFLARCGKSLPPTTTAPGTAKTAIAVNAGHIGDINSRLDDIQGLAEFFGNAVNALNRIG